MRKTRYNITKSDLVLFFLQNIKRTGLTMSRLRCSLLQENHGYLVGKPASDLVSGQGVTNDYEILA